MLYYDHDIGLTMHRINTFWRVLANALLRGGLYALWRVVTSKKHSLEISNKCSL